MALKPFVSNLDEVVEALREFYSEGEDGRFYLQVQKAGGYELADVAGLKSTLDKKKREAADTKASLEAFGDLDPDDVRAQLEELETLKANAGKPNAQHEEQIRQLTAKHDRERQKLEEKLGTKDAECTSLDSEFCAYLKKAYAIDALAKAGGNVDLGLPFIMGRLKVVKSEDGKRSVRCLEEDGETELYTLRPNSQAFMDVEEFVGAVLRKDEKLAPLFAGSGKSGGGGKGGGNNGGESGVNPWKAGTINLTEQMRIAREDPEKATRLKKEAGLS